MPDRLHQGLGRSLTVYQSFFHDRSFLIVLGVDAGLFGNKHPHGAFQQLVVWVSGFQFALKLPADLADKGVQMLDDMEHVNADHSLREDVSCHGNKAVVHVTAVKVDVIAFVLWKLAEVFFEVRSTDHRKDVDHRTAVTIDDVRVVFCFDPALPVAAPGTAVAFEFVDGDRLRKAFYSVKTDQVKVRVDDGF